MDAEERLRAEFTEAQREVVRDEDVTFYEKQAREHEGPALELACGSGRVYLELLRTGVDADGFDISAASLASSGRLRRRRDSNPPSGRQT